MTTARKSDINEMEPPPGALTAGEPEPATYPERIFAALIDWAILSAISAAFTILVALIGVSVDGLALAALLMAPVILVWAVLVLGYNIYFPAVHNRFTEKGQTPGKRFMKIKIVKTDGSEFAVIDAVFRLVGYLGGAAAFYLGFLWILVDDENRGWHDKLAGTRVVKHPPPD